MLETSSNQDNRKMSTTAQMTLRTYAGLQWPAESHKARITRLARKLGWGHRRTRSIYNAEGSVALRADEYAAVQALGEAREEYRSLEARLAALESLLFSGDEAFLGPQVDAFRELARGQVALSLRPGAGFAGRGEGDEPEDFSD
jgi:hypothetical protein